VRVVTNKVKSTVRNRRINISGKAERRFYTKTAAGGVSL
jgi:hypothetical protein